jgi:hypothetical protein
LKFSDASDAEIWLQGNLKQELIGFNPHFAGKSRRRSFDQSDYTRIFGTRRRFLRVGESDKMKRMKFGRLSVHFDVPDFRTIEQISKFPKFVKFN